MEDLAVQALRAKVDDYLRKPVNLRELRATLARLMHQDGHPQDPVAHARRHLGQQADRPHTTANLARAVGLSERHLRRCSLSHLVRALEEFQHLGVWFTSLREQPDLTNPNGRVMFAVIAAIAEFERELIRERIHAGLRRAKAQGKRLGRPPRVYHRVRVLPLR